MTASREVLGARPPTPFDYHELERGFASRPSSLSLSIPARVDADHASAEMQRRGDLGRRGQRLQVALDDLARPSDSPSARVPSSRGARAARPPTGSMLNSHGENTRTCPHSRTLAPTASPASKTSGSQAAGEQVRGGRQADRAGADHRDALGVRVGHISAPQTESRNFDALRRTVPQISATDQVFSICSGSA